MEDKTVYDLPDMTLKSWKDEVSKLIDQAIEKETVVNAKRGLLWARHIVQKGKL